MANPIKLKCTVSSIVNHDDVSTIVLRPSRRLPNFQPGQFLHLALDPFDPTCGFWPESRVFSIASTPVDSELTMAYAVKGVFTRRMREELTVGGEVWVRLPYGHFTLAAVPDSETILIAGGTGITPFISFLLGEMRQPSGLSLKLVYGVRRTALFLFVDVLEQAMTNLEGFSLLAFSEDGICVSYRFPVRAGSLSVDNIWQAVKDPEKTNFYLSGPAAMIIALKAGLQGNGVRPEQIRIDEWE
jgi:ferredoxin-NADP reductase